MRVQNQTHTNIKVPILLYRKEEIHSKIVNYLTEEIQSSKYKSRAVGVTSEVGLPADRSFSTDYA